MKNIYQLLFFFVFIFLISCKSDFEKHMSKFNDCVQEKQEEKKYKYKNIQEALNHYDFDVARDYLACHPSRGEVTEGGGFTGKTFHSPYSEDLKLIVESEIAYFVSQGELEKAEAVAKEAGKINIGYREYDMVEEYEKKSAQGFDDNIDKMIEARDLRKIYNYLLKKKESAQKVEYRLNTYIDNNSKYISAVREFNATLDKILSKYKYAKVDNDEIRTLIDLSLPELVKSQQNSCVLSDVYKKEATAKYLQKSN